MKEAWLVTEYFEDNTKNIYIVFEEPWDTYNKDVKHIVYAEIE